MVPAPRLSRFKISSAGEPEKAQARWVFESGLVTQHEKWIEALSGRPAADVLTRNEE